MRATRAAVVVVHGVGSQPPLATLGRLSQGLIDHARAQGEQPEARARVAAGAPWIDALDARAHQRYALWAWVSGVVALLLLAIVALLQQGRWRLLAPGVLLLAAGGPWLWLWWGWSARADGASAAAEAIPASAVALGLPAAARAWSAHLLAASADVAAGAVVWPPVAVAGAGAALVLLTLLAALGAWLRPPKRGRF